MLSFVMNHISYESYLLKEHPADINHRLENASNLLRFAQDIDVEVESVQTYV